MNDGQLLIAVLIWFGDVWKTVKTQSRLDIKDTLPADSNG